jgi:ADP-ribose pyrophosphatase
MDSELVYAGKWLKFMSKSVPGKSGEVYQWEYVERPNKKSVADGVNIIAIYKGRIILESVFRYPVDAAVLEFPAGMLEGLSPREAALKELREETGYRAEMENITFESPDAYNDPWKSTEATRFVGINVPETEENENPRQELEDEEEIEVILVPIEGLMGHVERICRERGFLLDARVFMFAKGIEDTKREDKLLVAT